MSEFVVLPTSAPTSGLDDALRARRSVVMADDGLEPTRDVLARLVEHASRPGVASASPMPIGDPTRLVPYDVHPASPAPPTVPLPCRSLCALGSEALSAIPWPLSMSTSAMRLVGLAESLVKLGFRHIATPGVALGWDPADTHGASSIAGWQPRTIESIAGDANTALEAHLSWAGSKLDGLRLVIDGACVTDEPFTGTQHLVVEIARWMATVRPSAEVMLATPGPRIAGTQRLLDGSGVRVVRRATDLDADVVYRPYQMLYASEMPFVLDVGRRSLVGQLDMIGFSNAFYHPSPELFFFARNIQRHLMRTADGITFISNFGRDSAVAECPDLEPDRLHVVSCGADPTPHEGLLEPGRPLDRDARFIVCLSSTFWHKNRSHAIRTFELLAERHGYDGHLVIAGPEPFYGQSTDAEAQLIDAMRPDLRSRIDRWGHVPDAEKWWLLRHADLALYPSVVEGFGLVPFESAAVGTPCLAHAGTAPGELLAGTGATVESWDPALWADRAAELMNDSKRAQRVTAAVSEAAEEHTWRRVAEHTWKAVDHALALPSRAHHGSDGRRLSQVGLDRSHVAPASSLRFNVARLAPGIRRRLRFARDEERST